MKKILGIFLGLIGCIYADSSVAGGTVAPIRKIECTINPFLDLDQNAKNLKLITCTINNNLPSVEFSFKIDLPGVDITSIKLHEVEGTRGSGLQLPMDKDLIPVMDGKRYRWDGTQTSPTIGYKIEIIVDWKLSKVNTNGNPGIYINMGG